MTEDSKKYKIYWDIDQDTPIIVNTALGAENNHLNIKYISTDLRPVFLEELFLISTLVPDLPKDIFLKSAWASQRGYFLGGEKIEVSLKKELSKIKDLNSLRNSIKNFQPTSEMLKSELHHIKNFIKANKDHLNFLLKSNQEDNEGYPIGAEPFIEQQVAKFKNRTLVVSFSGGKDSIVQVSRYAAGC